MIECTIGLVFDRRDNSFECCDRATTGCRSRLLSTIERGSKHDSYKSHRSAILSQGMRFKYLSNELKSNFLLILDKPIISSCNSNNDKAEKIEKKMLTELMYFF